MLASRPMSLRLKLTTWIVDQHRAGVDFPTITSANLDEIGSRKLIKFSEKKRRFFQALSSEGFTIGSEFEAEHITWQSKVAAWTECERLDQVGDFLELMREEHLINKTLSGLTPLGFAALEAVEVGKAETKQAFVAQWFSAELDEAYEQGIAPAVRAAGYEPFRIDRKEHNNRIDDEIIAEIRRSRFLIADFTCGIFEAEGIRHTAARGGVYYEAGFAQGLGTPVIWMVREDCLEYVHFDTRQFAHIVWSTPEDLRIKLQNRIAAVIRDER